MVTHGKRWSTRDTVSAHPSVFSIGLLPAALNDFAATASASVARRSGCLRGLHELREESARGLLALRQRLWMPLHADHISAVFTLEAFDEAIRRRCRDDEP